MLQQQTTFENIVGKGEIARNEQFLLFPQCFLLNHLIVSQFVHIYDIISLFASEFEDTKIGISGKGLRSENVGARNEMMIWTHFYPSKYKCCLLSLICIYNNLILSVPDM